MIDAIISALASGAASEASKELVKRIGVGLGMLLKTRDAPAHATAAAEKLERSEIDRDGLRYALSLLTERELAPIATEAQKLPKGGDITANLNFQGATINSSSIIGLSIGSRRD
ncbi:hypothetical protein [Bradyrhizobium monzae]|uniref:hypothetical protein n=1 Tax=Bradyrhizobium sp. Oc8 TaxID=2876780 RepID=UPI001F42BDBD|nr:hypothetical protein [Bradyrhizobium sp. Oc8]